jgi:transcriptional regulator with XRE-family HTH domain
MASAQPVGTLLRQWRQRRRLSQLDLALGADVSARHVSFIETGRSVPSRQMVMHLAQRLDVPLRERNALLLAAGYAPAFRERGLSDPAMSPAREAVDLLLAAC